MPPTPFSASGKSFSVREWRGSGPATLHVHHSDDEAWHVLDGELTFRYADRTENVRPGTTIFVPAGMRGFGGRGKGAAFELLYPPHLDFEKNNILRFKKTVGRSASESGALGACYLRSPPTLEFLKLPRDLSGQI